MLIHLRITQLLINIPVIHIDIEATYLDRKRVEEVIGYAFKQWADEESDIVLSWSDDEKEDKPFITIISMNLAMRLNSLNI